MISAAQTAARSLALAFLTFWGAGCVATVQARPTVVCLDLLSPSLECEADYIWVPGHWEYDRWSHRNRWVRGRYIHRRSYRPRY